MPLRILIDIFSGRPNPAIEIDDEAGRELLARVRPAEPLKRNAMPEPEHVLGYRGLIIEQTRVVNRALPRRFRVAAGAIYGPELAHEIADPQFEEYFFSPRGPVSTLPQPRRFAEFARAGLAALQDLRQRYRRPSFKWPLKPKCPCAPLYEPAWWNDGGQKQGNNNCYNYGTNYRSDTFAQPGQANGAMYTDLTCAAVLPAAVADALIDSPAANNKCPKEGHLVALVIAPGWDFHWYRKGRNGYWSHKPGGTPVTNLDNSSHLIPDPRTADRGPYTDFCTFMVVMHGHVKIQ